MTAHDELVDASGVQTSPTWEAWLTGISGMFDTIDAVATDGTTPGWSALLDVNRCPTAYLPWLGQFVGVTVDPTLPDASQRSAISARQGAQRGSLASIWAVAQQFLMSPEALNVVERDGSPYRISVHVPVTELMGGDYAVLDQQYATYTALDASATNYGALHQRTDALIAALQAAIPAGDLIRLVIHGTDSSGNATVSATPFALTQ